MSIREEHSTSRRRLNEPSIDRISDLPDSVLCYILSFLTTKFSIRTSLLAKRWRPLWSHVPNLVFRNENPEIINRVMLVRKVQNVNIFHLYHNIVCSAYQLETWITFAKLRNVQKLDLNLRPQIPLPRCLFTCETVVGLRLENCGVIPTSGTVCLPSLKKLHLFYVRFEADESLPHLISGCPVLEELSIKLSHGMVCCNVSSTTIKRMMLNFVSKGNGVRSEKLEMNTPALEYLRVNDSFSGNIKSGVLTSLVEAYIIPDNKEIVYFPPMLDFFDKLCNVKHLTLNLSPHCIEISDSVISARTTSFRNLTKLQLSADIRFLSMFLKNADKLETLGFSEFGEDQIEAWVEPTQQVPSCLLSHLKIIKLGNIKGKKHELGYIEYLLTNAKVLERMEIAYAQSITPDEKINMLQNISFFERGSTACRIAFV